VFLKLCETINHIDDILINQVYMEHGVPCHTIGLVNISGQNYANLFITL
jgi:hypothetical protein